MISISNVLSHILTAGKNRKTCDFTRVTSNSNIVSLFPFYKGEDGCLEKCL